MVLAILETKDYEVKKSALELATFAGKTASLLGTQAIGLMIGQAHENEVKHIGQYGLAKIYHLNSSISVDLLASAVQELVNKIGAKTIVLGKSSLTDSFVGRLSIKLRANVVSNVVELPTVDGGLKVKRSIYTGKAFETVAINTDTKILVCKKNAVAAQISGGDATVESFNPTLPASSIKVLETQKASGDILLTDAEIVVSGGLGMKGPENWYLIENLAKSLKAATGCSKPVSDKDWRPHHEHVGQTGVKVSPNIYIAVAISGAIQHLAGVNSSKVLVAINKDPEAPFFKAADYGIVGDAFEILPKLTAAAKNYVQ